MTSWQPRLRQCLQAGEFDIAITTLESLAGVTGTCSFPEKDKALHIIENHLDNLDQACEWLYRLLDSQIPSVRDLGALLAARLIPSLYPQHSQPVRDILARIADDPNWEVRETASYVIFQLVMVDSAEAFSLLEQWITHPSENLRRAVTLTVKKISKQRKPAWGEQLLDLIEPLMSDPSRYVRKNLGPFAIGDGLLRYYPELTLERLEQWSAWEDQQVLWNVAMVFSAAEGVKHLDQAIPILACLARDERRYVWRAVASAMRNLGHRSPEQVIPVLKLWLQDPLQARSAQVALKYLLPTHG